jgi:uncharacterized Zn finger protein
MSNWFPSPSRELMLDCSCPDDAVPCKHLAATFYLLAESFDEDPFGILAWRGREREDLMENLAAARSVADRAAIGPRRQGRRYRNVWTHSSRVALRCRPRMCRLRPRRRCWINCQKSE